LPFYALHIKNESNGIAFGLQLKMIGVNDALIVFF
jgi:hypothetical protein